jgi:excisionase family DNA binding protein
LELKKPMSEPNANPLEPFIDAIAEAVARKLATRNGEVAGNRPDKPLAPYLTVAEAADVSRLSVPTVRSLIRRGKLKGHRVGRRVVVKRAELERFLDAN